MDVVAVLLNTDVRLTCRESDTGWREFNKHNTKQFVSSPKYNIDDGERALSLDSILSVKNYQTEVTRPVSGSTPNSRLTVSFDSNIVMEDCKYQ
ncbi:hypothetical protein OUZ56_026983 [Daphnia magna]|uniref:Uncharacterized protein n=1 Tax=Daphnia magna TaxID=35525 RepID=A0ABQ9ZNF0_9CRUS|nr:hypothetical protein OUZ56_026983 [Daphnia magna]